MSLLRSLHRSLAARSLRFAAISSTNSLPHGSLGREASRSSFSLSQPSAKRDLLDCRSPFSVGIGSTRSFSGDIAAYPDIKDPKILRVFKDFMAADWSDLPQKLVRDARSVLSENTDDKSGKEALENVFRAATASEEFSGILISLKFAIDDSAGISGENVQSMPEVLSNALRTAYNRYSAYLDSFGPEEEYLKKKVETELGTRMIHLKLRCKGIGAEWGKVTLLGTSGISGSYVEQRS